MITKCGKQLAIKKDKNFNIISGTVDNKNPKSFYLNISSWAEPLIEGELDYTKVIRELNKSIKKDIYNNLDSKLFHVNRTIVDFDMRVSGIEYGKRSYMSCEITLFQKFNFKLQEKKIERSLDSTLGCITELLNNSIYFDFNKKKK
jgi:hypothetical protein